MAFHLSIVFCMYFFLFFFFFFFFFFCSFIKLFLSVVRLLWSILISGVTEVAREREREREGRKKWQRVKETGRRKKRNVCMNTRLAKRARKVVLVKLQQLPNSDSAARERNRQTKRHRVSGERQGGVKVGERGWLYICIREHSGVNQESRPFDFGVRKSDFFRKNLLIHSRRHQWKKRWGVKEEREREEEKKERTRAKSLFAFLPLLTSYSRAYFLRQPSRIVNVNLLIFFHFFPSTFSLSFASLSLSLSLSRARVSTFPFLHASQRKEYRLAKSSNTLDGREFCNFVSNHKFVSSTLSFSVFN